jgi:hypothetical protein
MEDGQVMAGGLGLWLEAGDELVLPDFFYAVYLSYERLWDWTNVAGSVSLAAQ